MQDHGTDFTQPLGTSVVFIYLGDGEGNEGSESRESDQGCALKMTVLQ